MICPQCSGELDRDTGACRSCGRPGMGETTSGPSATSTGPTDGAGSGGPGESSSETAADARTAPPLRPGAADSYPATIDDQPVLERLSTGRPTHFPSVGIWLKAGIFRNLRGVLGGLVSAWFYLPSAVFFAAFGGILLGIYGLLAGSGLIPVDAAELGEVSSWVQEVPLAGDALTNLAGRSGGILPAVAGVVIGAVLGLLGGLILLLTAPFEQGLFDGILTIVGSVVLGILAGVLYTLYRVACEGWLLRITGARRLSRREAAFLLPIVRECAHRLGMSNHPPVLIDDRREPNALAYTRHIVINHGLLEEFNYDREAIAAVVCHELVHWRNGDGISAAFIQGVAFPLYVVQASAGWLLQRANNSLLRFLIWLVFWPVFVTVRYVVVPLQAADSRLAEYRADEGAVRAGHRVGMRRVLARFRESFEGGRNGWVAAICASHPPNELRLERIEEPGSQYPLPDAEAPPLPFPVVLAAGQD